MYTYKIKETPCWQLQEAKAMFSQVVRSADQEPQIITVHGKESAVILSMERYKKLTLPKENLVRFMEQSPWASLGTELPRRPPEGMRRIEL
jgi:prevent-host-death family protein